MDPITEGILILKLALAGCGIQFFALLFKHGKRLTKNGTAYIGKSKEIRDYLGKHGIRISKNYNLSLKTMYEHIGIFGKTGSNKSGGIYIPNLLSNNLPKSSLIIPDMKGELYKLTSDYQKNVCGRRIVVFAPLNPEFSIKINPIAICRDITDIRKLAQTLLANAALAFPDKSSGGAEWLAMSTPFLTAALAYCKHKGGEGCNIPTALDLVISHSNSELELLFRNSTTEVMDQWNSFKTCLDAKGAAASIRITLSSALQSFLDYKIAATTSKNEFNPEELRQEPIALYIVYPDTKADYLAPLMATIFGQIIDLTLEYYDKHNNCLPIFNFYDEFANMGYVPGFNHVITTSRTKKFPLILCIHDVRQLIKLYGADLTYTMLNNLTTKIVLPGLSEPFTMEYISTLCGDTEVTVMNESRTGDKVTTSYSKQTKKLFTPGEVSCLENETCIIKINNKQPVIDKLNIYWKNNLYDGKVVKQYL